jgi:hypothetical protein
MKNPAVLFSIIFISCAICYAQTSAFTYQGRLSASGSPANGAYQFEFKLFDASTGTNQIGATQTVVENVQNGVFTTHLDFGAASFPAGSDRWLEISVRGNGSGDSYRVLSPRQQLSSVPFAVRSLRATEADNATNAASLAGVAASNYVQSSDSRLSDARTPIAGSSNYIQNLPGVGQQSASFNINGGGSANIFNAATQFNIRGDRVLSIGNQGDNNLFAGSLAGQANTAGLSNSFVGFASGFSNIDGHNNAFFGKTAGFSNSIGRFNAFFGSSAGQSNVTGNNNTAVGALADVGGPDLSFATAIGAGAVVSSSNTVVIGRSEDTVKIPGTVITTGSVSRHDPQLIATLRWDLAGQREFAVGSAPRGVAFDGANIWIANSGSNNVTKLRASDGACVSPCTFAVGTNPQRLAFDGANIWVVNNGSANVTKLRASDGANLGTFPAGGSPTGIAFDGAHIWVSNNLIAGTLTRLRASDGAIEGTLPVGSSPTGVAFDGTNIWVATNGGSPIPAAVAIKVRASDGNCVGQCTFVLGASLPVGIAFDGTYIWVPVHNVIAGIHYVARLRASDGGDLKTFQNAGDPSEVAFDGANMWVAGTIVIKLGGGGENLGTFASGANSSGIAFDGAHMWVTNSSSNTVSKLPVGP